MPNEKGVIYVAGPYRAIERSIILLNIQRAIHVAGKLRSLGYTVIVPHAESIYNEDCLDDEGWLRHGIKLLERCDSVCLIQGWEHSEGTKKERDRAGDLGMFVFEDYQMDYFVDLTPPRRSV